MTKKMKEKPWSRLGMSRREWDTLKPWKKAGVSKQKMIDLVLAMPQEAIDNLHVHAKKESENDDADRLVRLMFGQNENTK